MTRAARLIGVSVGRIHCRLSRRDISAFAAGIPDSNPRFFDDRVGADMIAPPTLPLALTWPLSRRLSSTLRSAGLTSANFLRQLHVSEALELRRPLRPADRLTIAGRVAERRRHRLGMILVVSYDATDTSGACVFREHFGLLLRDDETSAAVPVPPNNQPAPDAVAIWQAPVVVDPLAAFVYSACSGIYFSVHTSPAFAESVGLNMPILHGSATLALAVRELSVREAGNDPTRVRALSCRFRAPVVPGTSLLVRLRSRQYRNGHNELKFDVRGPSGELAVSDGCLRLGAPEIGVSNAPPTNTTPMIGE